MRPRLRPLTTVYPIRTTVTDFVKGEQRGIVHRHRHPGYRLSIPRRAKRKPLKTYTKGHEFYAAHEAIREDLARGMRESKICLFDSSVEKKMIRKYAQALLSGCVIAADLPTEQEEALSDFIIQLEPEWSMERIMEEIEGYLARPEELHRMSLEGMAYARQHLTTTSVYPVSLDRANVQAKMDTTPVHDRRL